VTAFCPNYPPLTSIQSFLDYFLPKIPQLVDYLPQKADLAKLPRQFILDVNFSFQK